MSMFTAFDFFKYLILVFVGVFYFCLASAQDSSQATGFKYVMLHADKKNYEIPDYLKIRGNLEDGIKELLVRSKVPMLKYQKEASEKQLQRCDTLVCTYAVSYANGMMLNAKIKCSLTFTDCHNKEVYTLAATKMAGAVATADTYLKVFAKLIAPDLMKHLAAVK